MLSHVSLHIAGFSRPEALLDSLGTGAANWLPRPDEMW